REHCQPSAQWPGPLNDPLGVRNGTTCMCDRDEPRHLLPGQGLNDADRHILRRIGDRRPPGPDLAEVPYGAGSTSIAGTSRTAPGTGHLARPTSTPAAPQT